MPRKILEQIIKGTSSHLAIKATSTKWAKANLFPFPASHQSYRKERGSKCHVSWLLSTFDSVSDVILIISKLKRKIYERVTQSLSENRSKRVSSSRHGGEMYREQQGRLVPGLTPLSIAAGAAEGSRDATVLCTLHPVEWAGVKKKVQFRAGTSSYKMNNMIQDEQDTTCRAGTMDKPGWAIAWLADGWAGPACELKPWSSVFLRQRQTPRWDVQTRMQLARRGQKLFSSPLQGQSCSWRSGSWFWGMAPWEGAHPGWAWCGGQPWGWQGAWRTSPTRTDQMHWLQLFCLKKKRRVFQRVGLQSGRELLYSLPVGQQGSFWLVTGE